MIAQLDQLDKIDFDQAIDQANSCIINRNFPCARDQLDNAATYAHGDDDHQLMQSTEQGLTAEIYLVRLEQEEEKRYQEQLRRWAAEERRLQEEERRLAEEAEEEAEAEAEEYEREQREYARQQRWEDDNSGPSTHESIMTSLQGMSNEIRELNAQLDRDTNAAIRQTNAFAAENRRRKEATARQQRMAEQQEAREQRNYERKQRQREREQLAKQRKREQQRLTEQRKRERERLAEQRRENRRHQHQAATSSSARSEKKSDSRYGTCFNYCKDQQGKHWEKDTPAGACEKGCSFRHWQANDESTNHERAKQQCSDKYGGDLYRWCINGVSHY